MDVRTQSKDGRRVASVAECEVKIAGRQKRGRSSNGTAGRNTNSKGDLRRRSRGGVGW